MRFLHEVLTGRPARKDCVAAMAIYVSTFRDEASDKVAGSLVTLAMCSAAPGIAEAEEHEREKGRLPDSGPVDKQTRTAGIPGTIKTDSAQQVPREDVEA